MTYLKKENLKNLEIIVNTLNNFTLFNYSGELDKNVQVGFHQYNPPKRKGTVGLIHETYIETNKDKSQVFFIAPKDNFLKAKLTKNGFFTNDQGEADYGLSIFDVVYTNLGQDYDPGAKVLSPPQNVCSDYGSSLNTDNIICFNILASCLGYQKEMQQIKISNSNSSHINQRRGKFLPFCAQLLSDTGLESLQKIDSKLTRAIIKERLTQFFARDMASVFKLDMTNNTIHGFFEFYAKNTVAQEIIFNAVLEVNKKDIFTSSKKSGRLSSTLALYATDLSEKFDSLIKQKRKDSGLGESEHWMRRSIESSTSLLAMEFGVESLMFEYPIFSQNTTAAVAFCEKIVRKTLKCLIDKKYLNHTLAAKYDVSLLGKKGLLIQFKKDSTSEQRLSDQTHILRAIDDGLRSCVGLIKNNKTHDFYNYLNEPYASKIAESVEKSCEKVYLSQQISLCTDNPVQDTKVKKFKV